MPVTKLESSLAKNSATLAMSAGWPSRFNGDIAADFAYCVVELVFAAAGDVDVSAFGDEECGCGQSHACGGSGDDCDLSMQFVMGVSSCVR